MQRKANITHTQYKVAENLTGETAISWTHSGAERLVHSAAIFAPSSRIISGYISQPNDLPIEDVFISATSGGSDITDANGYYELWVSYGWSGTVTPKKTECLFKPFEHTYNNVATDLSNQNYKNVWIYDLDSSGFIGWGDVRIIAENWLSSGQGDFNEDNTVDFIDFADFAAAW